MERLSTGDVVRIVGADTVGRIVACEVVPDPRYHDSPVDAYLVEVGDCERWWLGADRLYVIRGDV